MTEKCTVQQRYVVGIFGQFSMSASADCPYTEVEENLELGDFSFVVQLICRPITIKHHNKQFVTQGFLLPQPIHYNIRRVTVARGVGTKEGRCAQLP